MITFEQENERKSNLLNLFDRLETENLRARGRERYERVVKSSGTVLKIKNALLILKMESGETLKRVAVTQDIAASLKRGDVLSGGFGRLDKQWEVMFIDWIASPMPGKTSEHHVSMANPASLIGSEIRK